MSEPKTLILPISDCGCFVVGEINNDNLMPQMFDGEKTPPKYGIVVWYENKELAKAAATATMEAHWSDESNTTENENP